MFFNEKMLGVVASAPMNAPIFAALGEPSRQDLQSVVPARVHGIALACLAPESSASEFVARPAASSTPKNRPMSLNAHSSRCR
jgi:hypothetical protein